MYFSLVVRANESLPMPVSRMFEETNREVALHFTHNGSPDLMSLARYPIILTTEFQEGDTSTEAVIGYMENPSMNPRISHPVLKFPSSALMDCGILSGRWSGSRTRWTVFKGDPYRLLAGVTAGEATAEEETTIDERQVAVMMPFKEDASIDPVYQAIKLGVENADFRCIRVDQLVTPGDITDDIRRLIAGSRLVIADLSEMNPNVMYELGYAHGRSKKVILVSTDSLKDLPFDIRSQRVLPYQRNKTGLDDLTERLGKALRNTS